MAPEDQGGKPGRKLARAKNGRVLLFAIFLTCYTLFIITETKKNTPTKFLLVRKSQRVKERPLKKASQECFKCPNIEALSIETPSPDD